jgi:hypothetical protein
MTTTTKHMRDNDAEPDLDDLPNEVEPEPTKRTPETQWNGRSTRIRLAYPLHRGTPAKPAGRHLDSTRPCIDCGVASHQFHAAASKGSDGVWRGPEADSVRVWQEGGWFAGTPEAQERALRQRRRDELVGPEASPVLTADDLDLKWRFEMKHGVVNPAIENGLRRDEAEMVGRAVAAGIREATAERTSK